MPFPIHPHMLRHACGFKLANAGLAALSRAQEHPAHSQVHRDGARPFQGLLERLTLALGILVPPLPRRQARDDFRFPLNHLSVGAEAGGALCHQAFNGFQGSFEQLVRHRLDAARMLQLHLARHEHCADLQIRSRGLAPHPLENLPPMLLPIFRQIEQKALVERSARSLR